MQSRIRGMALAASIGALLALPGVAQAQGAAGAAGISGYGKDQKYIGAHVGMSGVGSTANYGLNGEVSYNEHIAIGGWVDTWSYGESFGGLGGTYDWTVRYIAIAGTGAYHFAIKSNPRVDPFAGAALGYYIVSTSTSATGAGSYSGSASRMFLGAYGGVRYFFTPSLGGVARVGFGSSYLTLGLDYRL